MAWWDDQYGSDSDYGYEDHDDDFRERCWDVYYGNRSGSSRSFSDGESSRCAWERDAEAPCTVRPPLTFSEAAWHYKVKKAPSACSPQRDYILSEWQTFRLAKGGASSAFSRDSCFNRPLILASQYEECAGRFKLFGRVGLSCCSPFACVRPACTCKWSCRPYAGRGGRHGRTLQQRVPVLLTPDGDQRWWALDASPTTQPLHDQCLDESITIKRLMHGREPYHEVEWLHVCSNGLYTVSGVGQAFPRLRGLVLDDVECARVSYDLSGLSDLLQIEHLELRLGEWDVEGHGLRPLRSLTKLRRLFVRNLRHSADYHFKVFESLVNLEVLYASGSNEGVDGGSVLDLTRLSKLEKLTLTGDQMDFCKQGALHGQALLLPAQLREVTLGFGPTEEFKEHLRSTGVRVVDLRKDGPPCGQSNPREVHSQKRPSDRPGFTISWGMNRWGSRGVWTITPDDIDRERRLEQARHSFVRSIEDTSGPWHGYRQAVKLSLWWLDRAIVRIRHKPLLPELLELIEVHLCHGIQCTLLHHQPSPCDLWDQENADAVETTLTGLPFAAEVCVEDL